MSEAPTSTETPPPKAKKSPPKTRHELLGYFFGQPLESFEKLLQIQPTAQPSTSASVNQNKIQPTDLDIIRHWMYHEDQNRTTKRHSDVNTIGIVTDSLIDFYTKYHPSVELRYKIIAIHI